MEILETNKYCIITPLSPKLNHIESDKLSKEITQHNLPIALNMEYVRDCTIDFIELVRNIKNISLYNIPSDIFAILTNMKLDKTLKLFVSESDFIDNKRQLLNRQFSIV